MREEDRKETVERYRQRWLEYGVHPRTLGWDKGCQWVRFEAALESLRREDYSSVLDLGCGFGDLLTFLRSKGWAGEYLGIDLVPEFLQEARLRHRDDRRASFDCRDIQSNPLTARHSMAIATGIFNHRLAGHESFIAGIVDAMWQASDSVVVCDFLSTTSDLERRRSDLSYQEPGEVYHLARRYSRRAVINHAYMPFEFQIKIWHDDSFAIPEPVFAPFRHLSSPPDQKAE